MMNLVKDIPYSLREWAMHNQLDQGNEKNSELYLSDNKNKSNFDWDESIEGPNFWFHLSLELNNLNSLKIKGKI